MSKVPKKTPHLVAKAGRFYFRMRVPLDLVKHVGKAEVTQALGDVSKSQAEVRAGQIAGEWSAHFLNERHRLGLAEAPAAAPMRAALPTREATQEEAQALAQLAARSMLETDLEGRIEGSLVPLTDDPQFGIGQPLEAAARAAIAGGDVAGVRTQASDWLASHGLTLPTDQKAQRRVLMAWAAELSKARKGQKLRDDGEPVDTPPEAALPASLRQQAADALPADKKHADALKLLDVFQLWEKDERQRPAKTVQKARNAVGHFERLTGNPSLGFITKATGSEFRRALLAEKVSDKTASDRLLWVQILLNFEASRYARIPANPWKGLTIKVKQTQTREEWKDADACKLFALPLFQSYELPASKNAGGPAAYWLPLIGAFTGARITEIAQLLVADIQFEDGQWFIRFAVAESWQSLKRDSSHRTIPMHTELVRLGLPEFAKAMHDAGESRLFPAIAVSALNNAGGGPSKWFSTLKSDAGFGPANTFHGWRNTVETKLQRAREGQLFIDRYLGHKPQGGEGPETYARISPQDLVDVAAKIGYEGLALPRVYSS